MGDLDTDPQMMRRQQDQDAAGTIAPDETRKARSATDSDPESCAAREAAKVGQPGRDDPKNEATLAANRRAAPSSHAATPKPDAEKGPSLVQPGRSRLGGS